MSGDEYGPGAFGFDYWVSNCNFFDFDPFLTSNGMAEKRQGESSQVVVDEALSWIETRDTPFLAVIW